MDSDEWIENYYQTLESRKDEISSSDFRFYNIGRMPLLAQKTHSFSKQCTICRNNIKKLEMLAESLPHSLQDNQSRKEFEQYKFQIEKHLQKDHGIKFATYYSSLYTLVFSLTGVITGLLSSLLILNKIDINLILICFAVGLIAGRLTGSRIDKKHNIKELQM